MQNTRKKKTFVTVLMCMVLGISVFGCSSKSFEPTPSEANDAVISDNENPAENADAYAPQPFVDSPQTATPQENAQQSVGEHQTEGEQQSEEPPKTEEIPQKQDAQTKTDALLCSTVNGLKVRQGAGTSYISIGTLDKGDMVMPVRKAGDWYEVLYMGTSAYVSAQYLTEATFDKASDKIEQVITEGKKLLGMPYVYGAQRLHFGNGSPNSAFDGKSYDCSSLMQYIFKIGADVNLAMTSREQSLQGKQISRSEIRRGDLLFFTNASRVNKVGLERIGHVALYLGDNIILHTASDHAVIERISDTRSSYFVSARRLLD